MMCRVCFVFHFFPSLDFTHFLTISFILFSPNFQRNVLERWKFTGLTRKLQIKPRKFDTDPDTGEKLRCKEVQLILKWGGDLTKLGENQAIKLGKQFRQEIYPDAP